MPLGAETVTPKQLVSALPALDPEAETRKPLGRLDLLWDSHARP